jgi:glycerol-3-phosphate dehydrogenase (NAD(P)+)
LDEAGGGRLAEGVHTARVLGEMARARGVDMPLAFAVDAVLDRRSSIEEAIDALMNRPLKAED